MRVSELIGRTAYDRRGQRLGRVTDAIVEDDPHGRLRLRELVIATRWYGRLVSREPHTGSIPRPLRALNRLLRQTSRHVPAEDVRFHPPVPGFPWRDGPPGGASR